jgi:sortase family protein
VTQHVADPQQTRPDLPAVEAQPRPPDRVEVLPRPPDRAEVLPRPPDRAEVLPRPPDRVEAGSASGSRHRRPPARRRRPLYRSLAAILVVCGLAATALGVGGWTLIDHAAQERAADRPSKADYQPGHSGLAAKAPGHVGRISGVPVRSGRDAVAKPAWLLIPAIGVSTTLIKLGLTSAGDLQVPTTTAVAGWYTGSPRPGQVGSSIIAGHIDSVAGPGIFYRLNELKRGEYVYIIRSNHTVAVFEVTASHLYAKAAFPSRLVYGPVPDAELRLITCGGTFDYATGSYLSNVVVSAVQIK